MVAKRSRKAKDKFVYGVEYQYDLLKYTVTDLMGYKALQYYQDTYFDLVEHQFIAFTIKQYWKYNKRVPGRTLLRESLIANFNHKSFANLLTTEDKEKILEISSTLYETPLRDADEIFNRCTKFKSYVELKHEVESVDLLDFEQYDTFAKKVLKAINITQKEDDFGTYLIEGISSRQLNRQFHDVIHPTPFKQLNAITNGGGYGSGSMLVIMDIPKQLKTAMMINVVRGYLRMRKKVAVFDLDNSRDDWPLRLEQSLTNHTKKEILSGELDVKVSKVLRKYKRLGAETFIKRMQSGCTSADIQAALDKEYQHTGFKPEILVIDYIGKMNALSHKVDDHDRILDAYQDIENMALNYGIHHVWSPHHVKNEAYIRESTKYKKNDMAKCTALGGAVHAIFGLNRNDDEKENGVLRMELVMQRDGVPDGRVLFQIDVERQRMEEFTKVQREEYDKQMAQANNKKKSNSESEPKREKQTDI